MTRALHYFLITAITLMQSVSTHALLARTDYSPLADSQTNLSVLSENALADAERRTKDGSLAASALDDYKANLAAAGATAAGSSGTGGFYASASAQTTTTEKESTNTNQNYVGSNINVGGNAAFNATDALSIMGSSVNVQEQLALNASSVTITAGTEESTSRSREETYTVGMSVSTSGASGFSAAQQASAASSTFNASANSSDSDSYSKTHINSSINAGSLTSTSDQFTLQGGNVDIQNDIDITTGQLTIASLQDESRSRSSSEGYNISGSVGGNLPIDPSNVGSNQSSSSSDSKWVNNQTTLIGGTSGNGSVNITADKTDITGATLASATRNEDGTLADNGNLTLITDELTITNLYDHNTSKSSGVNLSVGLGWSGDKPETKEREGYASGSTTLGLTNSGHNTEQTTYATLGGGTVQKKDGTAHDIADVNNDLNNTQEITLDQQTGGLDATVTVDHRLLSEQGRDQIKEDFTKSDMILDTLELMVTTDRVGIEDFFSETGKKNDTYEAVKAEIASNPELAAQLQNPDLSAEEKQNMLNSLTHTVMQELGYETAGYDNKIVAEENSVRGGFYSEETGDVYINDAQLENTGELVTVAGHELSHAMDDRSGETYSENDKETYATSYGENFSSYTGLALDINGYDDGMANTNNHVGNNSQTVVNNNAEYKGLDKSKGDSYLTPEQQKKYDQALDGCNGNNRCEYDVARAYKSLDDMQEVDRRIAQVQQVYRNVADGVNATVEAVGSVVDAIKSPIDTAGNIIDAASGTSSEQIINGVQNIPSALNQMADAQHQTLVDRDNAYIAGDSEALGKAEGDIATENLASLSIPGGVRAVDKLTGLTDSAVDVGNVDTVRNDVNAGSRSGIADAESGYPIDAFGSDEYHNYSLPNRETRVWYNEQVDKIDVDVPLTKENAERISSERAQLKNKARDLMSDQDARVGLDKKYPVRGFDYYEKKYREQGYSDEALWERIIQGGKTTNKSVNGSYGVGG